MVHVLGQFVEFEVLRDARHAPRFSHRFKSADQQLASVFLVIQALIRLAQDRQIARQAVNRFGHHVEMLTGVQRHIDASQATDLTAPHAGAIDHQIGGDIASVGGHADHPILPAMDRGDLDILDQFGAARSRALGHGMGDVGRVELAVAGQKHAADHTLSVDQWV